MDYTSIWQWVARLAAIALAGLSGWLLGRTPPDWRGDSEPVGGGRYGMPGYYDSPMSIPGLGFFAGSWGAGLAAAAAIVLIIFGWPEEEAIIFPSRHALGLLFSTRFWLLAGSWLVGWTISRVTDKGPVGPLE